METINTYVDKMTETIVLMCEFHFHVFSKSVIPTLFVNKQDSVRKWVVV